MPTCLDAFLHWRPRRWLAAALMASIDPSTLCACPTGYTCVSDVFGIPFDPSVQGSYCVNTAAVASVP